MALIDYAMAILATSEMEADELADFAATVAKAANIGVRAVKARIAKERREREQAERKAAMASGADGQNHPTAPGTRRRVDADRDLPGPGSRLRPARGAAHARRIGQPGRGAGAGTLGSAPPDLGRHQRLQRR